MRRHLARRAIVPRRSPLVAALVALTALAALGALAPAAGAQDAPDPALADACRRPLASADEVARAVREVEPALPWRAWPRITLAGLPASVSSNVRASVLPAASPGSDVGPVLYWRAPIDGAVVVHELTHALQAGMERSAHDGLLARVAAHDASPGFSSDALDAATGSVIGGIEVALGASTAPRARRALQAAVAAEPGTGRGALARREARLRRALSASWMSGAREALARRGVAGGEWRAELHALLLDEAHAAEAAMRCRLGLASAIWAARAEPRLLAGAPPAVAGPGAGRHPLAPRDPPPR